jgi:hypothetical protein
LKKVTPIKHKIDLGKHSIRLSLKGYDDFVKEIKPRSKYKKTLDIKVKMKVAKAKAPIIVPPVKKPTPKPVGPPATQVSSVNKPALLNPTYGGTLLGIGTVLAGVSTWLVFLHGDISCDDGRTRQTCPDVYNTRSLGYGGLIVGISAMSVGITSLLLNPLWPNTSKKANKSPKSNTKKKSAYRVRSQGTRQSQNATHSQNATQSQSVIGQPIVAPINQGAMVQWGVQF